MSRKKMVDDNFSKNLSRFIYDIAIPCCILDSMMASVTPEEIKASFFLPVVALIIIFVTYFLGKGVAFFVEKDKRKRGLMEFSFMFSNFTFTAYPVLQSLYGKKSIFYASIFNLGMFIAVLTIGIYVVRKCSEDSSEFKFSIKDLLSAPFISLLIGLLLLILPFKMPFFITSSLSQIGQTATPMGLLLTGLIAGKKEFSLLKNLRAYVMSFFRLLVIPVLAIIILKFFGVEQIYIAVVAIILANPVAVNLVIFSENFDADSSLAASYVIMSSILSVVTLPLINGLL